LPPPTRNIPGTDIPDRSRSEDANVGTDLRDADRNMPNFYVGDPNSGIDPAGEPPVNPDAYPGIINPPVRGGHRPRIIAPYRK
jgi:hypothetical protein